MRDPSPALPKRYCLGVFIFGSAVVQGMNTWKRDGVVEWNVHGWPSSPLEVLDAGCFQLDMFPHPRVRDSHCEKLGLQKNNDINW